MPKLATHMTCTGCGACADSCPHMAIDMVLDPEGFAFPKVDASRCVECGRCTQICPVLFPVKVGTRAGWPVALAGWSTTPEVRQAGSSGGVFAELAARTVATGGWVAGARMDGLTVRHDLETTLENIRGFMGSKYLQSETHGIYRRVLVRLKRGDPVLFSGTPCQVAGMRKLASGQAGNENLITCEVACLGVPSRRFWQRYVEAAGADIGEAASFRDKQDGWLHSYAMTLRGKGSGARTVRRTYRDGDLFLRAYAGMLVMRNSCYDCPFAAWPRQADVTLADFWGMRRFPEEQERGVSLVVANTQAGIDLLQSIPSLVLHPATWEEALPANPRIYEGKSQLPWRGFWARRHLATALRLCSISLLDKLYTGRIPRWQFWWWPYKLLWRRCAAAASRRRRDFCRMQVKRTMPKSDQA